MIYFYYHVIAESSGKSGGSTGSAKQGAGAAGKAGGKGGGGGGAGKAGSVVVDLTEANFNALVMESTDHWIIEFYAPWYVRMYVCVCVCLYRHGITNLLKKEVVFNLNLIHLYPNMIHSCYASLTPFFFSSFLLFFFSSSLLFFLFDYIF